MKAVAVIPARWASARFPGKPLAPINGRPMIDWVVRHTAACDALDDVIVATDDTRIAEAAATAGATVAMTGEASSGSDRIAQVVRQRPEIDVVINVQGDEPLINADVIGSVLDPLLRDPAVQVTTAARPFGDGEDPADPNRVKVVRTRSGQALYFSRALIPHGTDGSTPPLHHVGLYGYRRSALLDFAAWPVSSLEESERLEQLRLLENGVPIDVVIVDWVGLGVDSPGDINLVEERVKTVTI